MKRFIRNLLLKILLPNPQLVVKDTIEVGDVVAFTRNGAVTIGRVSKLIHEEAMIKLPENEMVFRQTKNLLVIGITF